MKTILSLVSCFVFLTTSTAHANIVVNIGSYGSGFSNGGAFDGDSAGDTASFTPELGASPFTVVLTTESVGPDGVLNENSGTLGVNSADGANSSAFDVGESWAFSFDHAGRLTDVDFGSFTTTDDEAFTISSATLGTLTFTNNGTSDRFSGSDSNSNSFGLALIPANEIIILSYSNNNAAGSGNATLQGLSFEAVPEPTTFAMFGMAFAGLGFRRRRA